MPVKEYLRRERSPLLLSVVDYDGEVSRRVVGRISGVEIDSDFSRADVIDPKLGKGEMEFGIVGYSRIEICLSLTGLSCLF